VVRMDKQFLGVLNSSPLLSSPSCPYGGDKENVGR